VPVVREGKIVGIVSRSNLVRALGAALGGSPTGASVSDDDRVIRARLLAELGRQQWAGKVWAQDIIVSNGIVHLWFGSEEADERRQAIRVAAENVSGVRGVEEHVVPVPLMPAL
jgi:CBS domain-containing protein